MFIQPPVPIYVFINYRLSVLIKVNKESESGSIYYTHDLSENIFTQFNDANEHSCQ